MLITLTGGGALHTSSARSTSPSLTASARSGTTASSPTSRRARGEADVDRQARLLRALKAYLEARSLRADWAAVSKSSNETLINSLSIVAPYGSQEKQALLEAPDLKTRAEMLVALAEMELAAGAGGSGSTLQ